MPTWTLYSTEMCYHEEKRRWLLVIIYQNEETKELHVQYQRVD